MRIALLADLHFGRAQPDLVPSLLVAIESEAPDLVVVAGDFVQRARPSQFALARDFLSRLNAPWLAVPGNHDIPLFNLPERLLLPRRAYKRWIAKDTQPTLETESAVILGIDTTHRWSRQAGKIRPDQITRTCDVIRRYAGEKTVFLVAHHPFHQAIDVEKKLMLGAPRALEAWAECGPHVILSGHLHQWMIEPFLSRKNKSMTLQVHCGTGLSTRLRGEPNEFAIIETDGETLHVNRFVTEFGADAFRRDGEFQFTRSDKGWH